MTFWGDSGGYGQDMPVSQLTITAATYQDESDALADYEAAKELYAEWNIAESYDAAVITKDEDGRVRIVRRHEQPVVHAGGAGLLIGLAVGAVVALFPAVTLGGGLLAGAVGGALIGAVTGHVVAGMSRTDLKDLGETLDENTSGLVIVASEDVSFRLDGSLSHCARQVVRHLNHDGDRLKKDIRRAMSAAV
ncbi:DUF1269 domain-containing protein [Nonomuraea sp. NPDC050790]|uniref:DUF1269 domain-containing protein n=1 Tax=Nonomuraea sp. NPDC050790 TaxID=3364371 RepID=UPI003789BC83